VPDDPAIRCRTCTRFTPLPRERAQQQSVYGACSLPGVPPPLAVRASHEGCADHASRYPVPKIDAETQVWDTPSGMGGTFTVTIVEDLPADPNVTVRVCYGRLDEQGRYHRWLDWDGYTFTTERSSLSNPRHLGNRRAA
jgi:hypothetical protein